MHSELKPFTPSRAHPFDFGAAGHLWQRAAFGGSFDAITETAARSPREAVAALVDGPGDDPEERGLDSIWEAVLGGGDADGLRAWLIARQARCAHQVREKIALFWHSHFATSLLKVRKVDWMARQYRLFLRHGLGTFETLLRAVTRDPAMIRWLDNETNAKGHANENYGRELLELFTLGDGNYTEKDIKEASRAFTGWHILNDRYHFSKTLHDAGVKTVLGKTGPFGGDDVIRIALDQEACGRFLATKLLRFFVTPKPDAEVAASLGKEMRRNGYHLSATLKLLFGSRYFFDRKNRGGMIKSPIEYVVGAARAFQVKLDGGAAVPALRHMGQDLLAPPNVAGWPGHNEWINTASWLARVNGIRNLVTSPSVSLTQAGRALLGDRVPQTEIDRLQKSGASKRDLAHALLALPEAHMS